VGYIIGPKTAGIIFAGGVFSWLVLMPLIYFFGKALGHPIYPGTVPVADMGPANSGLPTSAHGRWSRSRRRPHHPHQDAAHHRQRAQLGLQKHARWRSLHGQTHPHGARLLHGHGHRGLHSAHRPDVLLPRLQARPGAQVSVWANLAASVLIVFFGFLFVTVSSRIVGLIGSSANPSPA